MFYFPNIRSASGFISCNGFNLYENIILIFISHISWLTRKRKYICNSISNIFPILVANICPFSHSINKSLLNLYFYFTIFKIKNDFIFIVFVTMSTKNIFWYVRLPRWIVTSWKHTIYIPSIFYFLCISKNILIFILFLLKYNYRCYYYHADLYQKKILIPYKWKL